LDGNQNQSILVYVLFFKNLCYIILYMLYRITSLIFFYLISLTKNQPLCWLQPYSNKKLLHFYNGFRCKGLLKIETYSMCGTHSLPLFFLFTSLLNTLLFNSIFLSPYIHLWLQYPHSTIPSLKKRSSHLSIQRIANLNIFPTHILLWNVISIMVCWNLRIFFIWQPFFFRLSFSFITNPSKLNINYIS